MFLHGVGKVTLHRRTEIVSLLYHPGDIIPEKNMEFVRARITIVVWYQS